MNLTGQTFGRLTVIRLADNGYVKHWLCLCRCGKRTIVLQSNLRKGHTLSCGCYLRETITTHGKTKSAEYKIWSEMVQRCTNQNNKKWVLYGGRGIQICDRWRNSFSDFLSDVGPRPSHDLTIERIDGDLGYEPSNVKWATYREQNRHTSRNHFITHNGTARTIAEWSEILGLKYTTLCDRIQQGWPLELALSAKTYTKKTSPVISRVTEGALSISTEGDAA